MAGESDNKKTVRQPISQVEPTQLGRTGGVSPTDPLIGSEDLIAGYRLVDKLGEGGMGVVYRGIQLSLNRDVAIKVMKVFGNDSDTGFQARFKREALAAAKLNHPHIVSIFDHGSAHGTIYMVLEFIEGKDCGEILQESGPYTEAGAFDLIRDVVLGLSHAAEEGVIHRDIKPANIMVAYKGMADAQRREGGVAKLTDFGIAALHRKAKEPGMTELTQQGTVIGTPGYMSPEQSMGKEVDFRSDIYSLGCTLYYLLTGKPPYFGQTAIEVFHNKMTQQIPNPRDLREGVSEGAVKVIAQMMARDADDRYQDYEDLLSDIDDVLAGRTPARAPIPDQSQSIAPSVGMAMGDETAMAATALAGTAPSTPMRPAPKAGATSSTGGKKLLPILGVLGLLLLGGGLFFAFSGGNDEEGGNSESSSSSESNANPVSLATFLDELEATAPDQIVQDLGVRKRRFRGLVDGVESVEERAAAEKRFDDLMKKAVRDTDAARRKEVDLLRRAADWTALYDRLEKAQGTYETSGYRPSSSMRKLLEVRDDVRDLGATERQDWQTIVDTDDTDPKKRQLVINYLAKYEAFTPNVSEANGILSRLPASGESLAACEAMIREMAGLDLSEFIERGKALEDETRKAIAEVRNSTEKRRLRAALSNTVKERRQAFEKELIAELDRVWRRGDYETLARRLPQVTTDLKSALRVRRPEDKDEIVRYSRIVKAAVQDGLGEKERALVRKVKASGDNTEVAKLLRGFAETYWFSPDLDEMKERLERAASAVPILTVKSPGAQGDLLIDGVAKGRTPWTGPLGRGFHRIEIRKAGFYPVDTRHDHREEVELTLPLFARPASRLNPVAQRRLALLTLPGHPLRRKASAAWGPAIGGSMDEVPEEAALTITSGGAARGWVTSTLALQDFLTFRTMRDSRGWRVTLNVRRNSGMSEVRLEDGANVAVVRLESSGISIGRPGELFPCPDTAQAAGKGQALALEWHGDVLVVRPGTSNSDDRVLGSIRFDKLDAKKVKLTIAVREGEARFGDMHVQKMN